MTRTNLVNCGTDLLNKEEFVAGKENSYYVTFDSWKLYTNSGWNLVPVCDETTNPLTNQSTSSPIREKKKHKGLITGYID